MSYLLAVNVYVYMLVGCWFQCQKFPVAAFSTNAFVTSSTRTVERVQFLEPLCAEKKKKKDEDDDVDREEERARLLEMGGDPSFLMDEASALEAVGGDPFFLPHNTIDEPQLPSNNNDNDNIDEDKEDNTKQDWFDIGRQMAKQLLEEDQEDEEQGDTTEPVELLEEEKSSGDSDPIRPIITTELEQAQSLALEASQTLVQTSEALCQSKQQALSQVQDNIQKLQEQLLLLQEQQTNLQSELATAQEAHEQSIQSQNAMLQAFGGASAATATDTPSTKSKEPYYSALEGDTFDNQRDELEALGGDPFFLVDSDDDTEDIQALESETKKLDDTQKQPNKALLKSKLTNEPQETESLTDEEELLEVGGDPAFLDSYDETDSKAYNMELMRDEVLELGGDPFFLEAPKDNAIDTEVAPNDALEPMASSSDNKDRDPSFLLNLVQKQQKKEQKQEEKTEEIQATSVALETNTKVDDYTQKPRGLQKSKLTNEPQEKESFTDEEQLLEVGGDPAFLDSYDATNDDSKAYDMELRREEILELGGDPSFL
ncbi:expressed unknown protein [Seminavis robusta]|uniref:Uncharacterized protein n=1 Tax=Seminavis robusta TaxID=568900 RepID=A0A9N8EHC4_9STRA|nr:expressed unknown protein [Seminavis robusta]|eukprot:Sro1082_g239160.1 n/a (543) ;mRNA; f:895-2523